MKVKLVDVTSLNAINLTQNISDRCQGQQLLLLVGIYSLFQSMVRTTTLDYHLVITMSKTLQNVSGNIFNRRRFSCNFWTMLVEVLQNVMLYLPFSLYLDVFQFTVKLYFVCQVQNVTKSGMSGDHMCNQSREGIFLIRNNCLISLGYIYIYCLGTFKVFNNDVSFYYE